MMDILTATQTQSRQLAELTEDIEARYQLVHQKMVAYKQQAHYWESQFTQYKSREKTLALEIETLKAKLAKREQQLFGKRSERSKGKSEKSRQFLSKKRGQQINNPGPSRRTYEHLPVLEDTIDLHEADKQCASCHQPFKALKTTEDSEVLEVINVQAHRRIIRRQRYQQTCQCPGQSKVIIAPTGERLIPKSKFGVSIWVLLLIEKYHYQRPLHRVLQALSHQGLALSHGSITTGMKKLLPLLLPVYNALQEKSEKESHWHADETRWQVFAEKEGKVGYRWFLWLFRSEHAVVYKLEPSRSSEVPRQYFKESTGILSVDRYVAYKAIAKEGVLVLAFCWAHVRRDFLEHAKGYPHQEAWAMGWVEQINQLYHHNNLRSACEIDSKAFKIHDKNVRNLINTMQHDYLSTIKEAALLPSAIKLMESLDRHWPGLNRFIENPTIPMDNNKAERTLRNPVIGRKNYYGSGSLWSGELTVILFSLFQSLDLYLINQHTWLTAYFKLCAFNHGNPPDDIQPLLPWNMTTEQLEKFKQPLAYENSS